MEQEGIVGTAEKRGENDIELVGGNIVTYCVGDAARLRIRGSGVPTPQNTAD